MERSVPVQWFDPVPEGEAGDVAMRLVASCAAALAARQPMPHAFACSGHDTRLRGVWKVKARSRRYDVRVYLFVLAGVLHVLHVDPAKRRTEMIRSTVDLLARRRNQLIEADRRGRARNAMEAA